MRLPSRTPPTRPAAAVATPVTTATFDEPFELTLRALELRLRVLEPDWRDDAAGARLVDALAPLELFARLPDELAFLGLDPFEVRDAVFRLLWERELAWATAPP
jgi:hypothetical protein